MGGAVLRAAAEVKKQVFARAAVKLAVSVEMLESDLGMVRVIDAPERVMSFRDVMKPVRGETPPIIMGHGIFAPPNDYSFAAQFVEVEVDTETGQTRLLQVVAVHDIGKAINPAGAEGQVEGGLHQGMGYALIEDMVVDPVTGKTLNANFVDYKLLTAQDMPEIKVDFIESGDSCTQG